MLTFLLLSQRKASQPSLICNSTTTMVTPALMTLRRCLRHPSNRMVTIPLCLTMDAAIMTCNDPVLQKAH